MTPQNGPARIVESVPGITEAMIGEICICSFPSANRYYAERLAAEINKAFEEEVKKAAMELAEAHKDVEGSLDRLLEKSQGEQLKAIKKIRRLVEAGDKMWEIFDSAQYCLKDEAGFGMEDTQAEVKKALSDWQEAKKDQ